MAEDHYQEKTEPATSRRREEARQKGQIPRSKEISFASIILGFIVFSYVSGGWMVMQVANILQETLSAGFKVNFNEENIFLLFVILLQKFLFIMAPIAITFVVMAIIANVLQGGIVFSSEALTPKLSNLNPVSGLKKFVSKNAFVELLKSLFKVLVLGSVGYITIKEEFVNIPLLVDMDGWHAMAYMGKTVFKILIRTAWVLIILSVFDYLFKVYEHEEQLKMTREEVKEEMKNAEGDPQVRSRIRSLQMEMARRRMMAKVPDADVVITNPTTYAVALKYDRSRASAPLVVAKGAELVAEIKSIAEAHQVPILEDKPLARALYRSVDIGREIPEELYHAVAEVLAYAYQLRAKRV
jgi:flagellar biosynthetic protein FlhB